LIFVVDSNDRERVGEANDELHKMVSHVASFYLSEAFTSVSLSVIGYLKTILNGGVIELLLLDLSGELFLFVLFWDWPIALVVLDNIGKLERM